MTGLTVFLTVINIVLTLGNVAIFYLTTKARRARRRVHLSPQSTMAKEAPHMHSVNGADHG